MLENREFAIDTTLVFEGVNADNPNDPGGKTRKGITQRTYDSFRDEHKLIRRSVFLMTDVEMQEIYRRQYMDPISFDKLPAGLDVVVYDAAVNSGPRQAGKWLQRGLGSLYTGKIDGMIGLKTLDAVSQINDVDVLIGAFTDRRVLFQKHLNTFPTFGKGWLRRDEQVETIGQKLAVGSVTPAAVYSDGMHQKADLADAKKPPARSIGATVAGAGTAIGTSTATAATQTSTFFDAIKANLEKVLFLPHVNDATFYLDHLRSITEASLGITATSAGIAAAGGGLFWAWAKKRAATINDALDTAPQLAGTLSAKT